MPDRVSVLPAPDASDEQKKRAAFVVDVLAELARAKTMYPEEFHSHHEGYAVLEEEVLELREIVHMKRNARVPEKTYAECVQIAAMAMQFATELAKPGAR